MDCYICGYIIEKDALYTKFDNKLFCSVPCENEYAGITERDMGDNLDIYEDPTQN